MKKRQKRAFTLTELLVTVVIIGVLAAVVLPKFNKIMEGMKTGEAERMLTAVRTEQEARCTLGQDYLADGAKVRAFPGNTSKNYTYAFTGNGMSAQSKTSNYTLQMPSYMDGRICCEGTGCAGLNKDYPTCDSLKAQANYQPGTECAAAPVPPPPPTGCGEKPTQPADKPCGCNNTGHQSYTWNEESCEWELGTTCEGEDTSGCEACTSDAVKQQNCEQGDQSANWTPGTWDNDTCDCICPEGYPKNANGACVGSCTSDPVKQQNCEQGSQDMEEKLNGYSPWYDIIHWYPGTWDTDECKCKCPTDKKQNCLYGSQEHPTDWVPGYWIEGDGCACYCPTVSGAKKDNSGGCYRPDCHTVTGSERPAAGWDEAQRMCEVQGFTACSDGTYVMQGQSCSKKTRYVKGKWIDEKCQCDCPVGSVMQKWYCLTSDPRKVDDDHSYGDYAPDAEEGPEYDPEDVEIDDDTMEGGWDDWAWVPNMEDFRNGMEDIDDYGMHDDAFGDSV